MSLAVAGRKRQKV